MQNNQLKYLVKDDAPSLRLDSERKRLFVIVSAEKLRKLFIGL